MFNRRFLRIKVMQALYAYFRDEKAELKTGEKNLFTSIERSYELFLYLLSFLQELQFSARISIEEGLAKRLPTQEDLSPNKKFVDNAFFNLLEENRHLKTVYQNRKISWQNDQDLARKVFHELKNTGLYKAYMAEESGGFGADKKLAQDILEKFLYEHELFNFWFEEKNIHWTDDLYFAFFFLNKWIDNVSADKMPVPHIYREEESDKKFITDLYAKTILHSAEFDELIDRHTKNWELERIATIDVLLMKMALTEILYASSVPVKVSMNEYIDIAKEYSTPQSGGFINGVLDRIVAELKAGEKIQKTGRGLLES